MGQSIFRGYLCRRGTLLCPLRPPSGRSFIFGLRIDKNFQVIRRQRDHYLHPTEHGITATAAEGLCVYCQFILQDRIYRTPAVLSALLDESRTCELCNVLVASFYCRSPLLARQNKGCGVFLLLIGFNFSSPVLEAANLHVKNVMSTSRRDKSPRTSDPYARRPTSNPGPQPLV